MASGHGNGGMSLSMKFIRLLIVLFNLAFFVAGITLLAIGVYVIKDPQVQKIRPFFDPNTISAYSQSLSYIEIFAIAIIVIGGVLLALGFLGCCGAIKGFRFLHVLYSVIIGAIIIAEIALVVVFVSYQTQFRSELVPKLRASITTYYVGPQINNLTSVNPVSAAWDFAQFNLHCCGAISQNDFSSAVNWNRADPYQPGVNLTVPFTCCPMGAAQNWNDLPSNFSAADQCATSTTGAYSQGCYDRLLDIIATYKNNVIIGLVVVGVVEILAFIFAILLYCRKDQYVSL